MQPCFASVSRISALFLLGLSLLSSWAVAQYDGGGVEPSLRSVIADKANGAATPNYVIVDLPEKKLLHYYPELKGLVPAQSQQELPKLLERVGENEKLLLNLPSICADETVVQDELDKHGWARGAPVFTGHYSYLVRAHVAGEGIRFGEGRTDQHWQAIDPHVPSGYSLIQGFALMPMHFHPFHQEAAHFRYLGRQILNNREDYVVAFAQEPGKAELLGSVLVKGADITVAYQGIAWIDPDNFQIARMRTDLLKARPEAGTETTETQFSEVRLAVVAKSFWLPSDVVVTRRAKDGTLREKHQFSDYKVFVK
jgi:hypothetical protein